MEQAIFAAGCFWGVEAAFRQVEGVTDAVSGYAGGRVDHPSYEQVCTGRTGHAEAVLVTYDPAQVDFGWLLEVFFSIHDPTQKDRQGPDVGTQYRSAIFPLTSTQEDEARTFMAGLEGAGRFARPIATTIEQADRFWPAEDYHQRYFERRGIAPHCHLPPPRRARG